MGAIGSLAKGIIGIFAVLLGIIGIAFLAVAGLVAVEFRTYATGNLFNEVYLWGPVGVGIVLGIILLLLGIFGICGVCCEKKGFIKAFAGFMLLLIALEIAVAVLVYVYRANLNDELQKGIMDGIVKAYNDTGDTNTMKALDKLQETLKCCGGNGTSDYVDQGVAIPSSCCVTKATNCTLIASPVLNTEGCTTKLQDLYKRYSNIIFGIAIAFAVLEILALLYSCYAANQDDDRMV